MAIVVDRKTEQRIEREVARGAYRDSGELLAHALDLVEAEESWLTRNRCAIEERLAESFAQAERGEGYSVEQARELLRQHRARRSA
jgi:Arc/MetJ-type ribon-helix-helix transcriptional regulator